MSLRVCTSYDRHVRSSDSVCPFCAMALGTAPEALPARWGTRAVILFGAAATALGCGVGGESSGIAAYGCPTPRCEAPPVDAGSDATTDAADDAALDAGKTDGESAKDAASDANGDAANTVDGAVN